MKNSLPLLSILALMLAVPSGLGAQDRAPAPSGDEKLPAAMAARQNNAVQVRSGAHKPPVTTKPSPQEAYGKLPLQFEENRGQSDARVKYLARGRGYLFFVTPQETVLALRQSRREGLGPPLLGEWLESEKRSPSPVEQLQTVLRFRLEGANAKPRIEAADRLPGISNYFIGNDPAKWRTKIPNYAKVIERNVYPGIDAAYYGKEGRLESDFIVAPGRDPGAIRLKITGAKSIEVNSAGDLVLATSAGDVKLAKPVLYQTIKGARKEVEGGYRLLGENEAGFEAGSYDHGLPLVIDPTLVYSTYLGGSSSNGESGNAIAVNSTTQEACVTGRTLSADFPLQNPEQGALGGPGAENVFVTKFSAAGSLVFSTYLGGSGSDQGLGIAVDTAGEPYVTGNTTSANFPKMPPTGPGLAGGEDAFVTKLSANGAALVFSIFLGGNAFDTAEAIAVDSSGNAYVTGETNSTNFPVTAGVFQSMPAFTTGGQNAFAAKISAAGTVTWATYLGGNAFDRGRGIAVDGSGNVYVAGDTSSTTFPLQSPIQGKLNGSQNAFITELNPAATALVFSTYLGGSIADSASAIAFDPVDNTTVVVGSAGSPDFPILGSLQAHDSQDDFFVAKIAPGGASLVFSTLFGDSSGNTQANAMALDSAGNIYVTGSTRADFLPTLDPLQGTTPAGHFFTLTQLGQTAFVIEFKSDGSDYLFSSFLGGSQNLNSAVTEGFQNSGNGIAVDSGGSIYVTGLAGTSDFPTVNPFQAALRAVNGSAFVAKISPATPAGPQVFPSSLNLGTARVGSATLTQIVTIANGTNTLNFVGAGITIVGPNAADFSEADSCGPTLLPHVVCTVAIKANPTATGPLTATLQINDSDPTSPQTVSLTAMGGTPTPPPATGSLTFSQSSLAFAPQEVTTTSGVLSLLVTNTSTGTVSVNFSPLFLGTDPGDFNVSFSGANPCFFVLAAGANCNLYVNFTPHSTGPRSAMLRLAGNFTGSPMTINLTGTGTPQIAVLSTNALFFGNQVTNTTSAPQAVTLMNMSASVTVTGIVVTYASGAFTSFPTVTTPSSCGAVITSLGPGQSCTITLRFMPIARGFASVNITVTDSDPAPQVFSASGTGLNAVATLDAIFPTQLPFARQTVGTTSPPSGVQLSNVGNTALVFTETLSGTNTGDFGVSDTCGGTIGPGGLCFLLVTFTPAAVGPRSATVTLNTTAAYLGTGVPQVSLTGTGVNPTTAAVAPTTIIFPNTVIGVPSAPQLATYSDTGPRPLVLSSARFAPPTNDFAFTFVSNGEATIGCSGGFPGARYNPQVACPISFTFKPTATGLRTATFMIMDSSSNSPHMVTLQGNGFNGSAVTISPNPLAFGNQARGIPSAPLSLMFSSNGTAPLTITAFSMGGANAGDFTQVPGGGTCGPLPITINVGLSCTVQFIFKPSALGAESATLMVTDSAVTTPQSVSLTGTGTVPMVTFTPATGLDFGPVPPMMPSAPLTVTLQVAAGTGTLQLTSISITAGTGTGPNDFAIAPGTTCPTGGGVVAAGTSCVVTVILTPSAAGTVSATLNFAGSNLTGSPVMLPLTGIGASTAAGFTLTGTSTSSGGNGTTASVLPGDTAVFTLILQPNPGFIGPITVACLSGIPSTIATASPTMINVTTTPSPPITIICTLRTNCVAQLVGPPAPGGWPQSPAPVPPFTAASGVALLLALWWRQAASRSFGTSRPSAGQVWTMRLIPLWATFVLLLLVITWTACVSNPPPAIPNAPTTPAGVYQIQVVATAPGGVRQVVSLNVHVI